MNVPLMRHAPLSKPVLRIYNRLLAATCMNDFLSIWHQLFVLDDFALDVIRQLRKVRMINGTTTADFIRCRCL